MTNKYKHNFFSCVLKVLCKNRYVGRSFIQPTTRLRQLAVARKFGPYVENIVGKRIVLVDDSIVRGTTMQPMVALLRSCGAKEVRNFFYIRFVLLCTPGNSMLAQTTHQQRRANLPILH